MNAKEHITSNAFQHDVNTIAGSSKLITKNLMGDTMLGGLNSMQQNLILQLINIFKGGPSTEGASPSSLAKLVTSANAVGQHSGMSKSFYSPQEWIIDSGASDHVTKDLQSFEVSQPTASNVHIPNGATVPVKAIGKVVVNDHISLHDVLGVPEFTFNLLSVRKLTKDLNCMVTFGPDFCEIQDIPSRRLIGVGKVRDGLYYLEQPRQPSVAAVANKDAGLLHQRLGHLPVPKLKLVSDFSIKTPDHFLCDACCRARQT